MKKKLTATEAKALLLPIPNDKFITGEFTDKVGKCCFIGHIKRLTSDNPKDYSYGNCADGYLPDGKSDYAYEFRKLTAKFIKAEHRLEYHDGSDVNNAPIINGYKENNPKDRVMHLLDDMIAKGY